MALEAFPFKQPGAASGNAQNQNRFYQDCVAKNGEVTKKGDAIRPSDQPASRN